MDAHKGPFRYAVGADIRTGTQYSAFVGGTWYAVLVYPDNSVAYRKNGANCNPEEAHLDLAVHFNLDLSGLHGSRVDWTNFADRQRAHDAADVSLRLVFGDAYALLPSSDMLNVRHDFLRGFKDRGETVSQYRDRVGGRDNLQQYVKSLRK